MMDITAIRIPSRATQWQCTTIQIAQFDYVLLDHIELSPRVGCTTVVPRRFPTLTKMLTSTSGLTYYCKDKIIIFNTRNETANSMNFISQHSNVIFIHNKYIILRVPNRKHYYLNSK